MSVYINRICAHIPVIKNAVQEIEELNQRLHNEEEALIADMDELRVDIEMYLDDYLEYISGIAVDEYRGIANKKHVSVTIFVTDTTPKNILSEFIVSLQKLEEALEDSPILLRYKVDE